MQSSSPPLFLSPEPSFPRHKQSTSSSLANPHYSTTSSFSVAPHHHDATASTMSPRRNSGPSSLTERPAKRQRRDSNSSRHSPRTDGSSRVQIIDLLDDDAPVPRRASPASWAEIVQSIDLSTPRHDQHLPQGSRLQPIEIKEEDDEATPPMAPPHGITLPPISSILGRMQQEQVPPEKPTDKNISFKNMTCVICMDKPTDLTAASCGHAFCHTCLMEALIAGENRARMAYEPKRSQCPVCRKTVNKAKASDVIPLLIMKSSGRLSTKPEALRRPVA